MKSYNNLPSQQRLTQRLADQFNTDEQLWQNLAWKRVKRRRHYPDLSAKRHSLRDLLEFDKVRPPQDCIGETEMNELKRHGLREKSDGSYPKS